MAVYLPSCEPPILLFRKESGVEVSQNNRSVSWTGKNTMTLALCWNNSKDFGECLNRMQTLGSLKVDAPESMVKLLHYMPSLCVLKSIADTGGTYARILEAGWSVPIQEYQEAQHKFSRD